MALSVLQYQSLSKYSEIIHFSTQRGVAQAVSSYDSFNIYPHAGDHPSHIAASLEQLAAYLQVDPAHVIIPKQVHEDTIGVVDHPHQAWVCDALITQQRGICLTVSTADCVPVLLYAPDQQVIAAVHAGWRGCVKRIVSQTVQRMVDLYGCDPQKMIAAIGPSISATHFEVGQEVVDAFEQAHFTDFVAAISSKGKPHIDLWKAVRQDLRSVGVCDHHIETSGVCTVSQHHTYFSARTLGIHSGRISNGIMLR